MGRQPKVGAEFFPHQVKHGGTLFALERRWRNDGYAFWFKLLEALAAAPDHTIVVDEESPAWTVFLERCWVSAETAREILGLLAKLDAIDRELWEQGQTVWCQNLVNHFSNLYQKRHKDVPERPSVVQRRAISATESAAAQYIRDGNDTGGGISTHIRVESAQRREERSREEQSREEESRAPPAAPPPGADPDPCREWVLSWFREYTTVTTRMAEPGPEHFRAARKAWSRHAPADTQATVRVYFHEPHWFTKDRKYSFLGYVQHLEELVSALGAPAPDPAPPEPLPATKTCPRGHTYLADRFEPGDGEGYCRYCATEEENAAKKAARTTTPPDDDPDFGDLPQGEPA